MVDLPIRSPRKGCIPCYVQKALLTQIQALYTHVRSRSDPNVCYRSFLQKNPVMPVVTIDAVFELDKTLRLRNI